MWRPKYKDVLKNVASFFQRKSTETRSGGTIYIKRQANCLLFYVNSGNCVDFFKKICYNIFIRGDLNVGTVE